MRVSRTLPALVALLLATACSGAADLVAPENAAVSSTEADGGIGQIGSGNTVAGDSTSAPSSAPAGGIGQFGSGN